MNNPDPIATRSRQAASDILHRMLETTPVGWEHSYRIGDTVQLLRPELTGLIPVGATGRIVSLDDPEGVMYSKGRPFEVSFDLRPYQIPIRRIYPKYIVDMLRDHGLPDDYLHSTSGFYGPNDLEIVGSPLGYWWYIVPTGADWHLALIICTPHPDDCADLEALTAYIARCVVEDLEQAIERDPLFGWQLRNLVGDRVYFV